ncbi:unnamed protein product [Leptidea sinapis]|uniref:Uncharacterized protein n=1 Tax=Leptidea sinapis TaxID=189913 RepID=A0A5E4QET5_9NEOP|nr:unnamed protein product [Leptidea sinapis]
MFILWILSVLPEAIHSSFVTSAMGFSSGDTSNSHPTLATISSTLTPSASSISYWKSFTY